MTQKLLLAHDSINANRAYGIKKKNRLLMTQEIRFTKEHEWIIMRKEEDKNGDSKGSQMQVRNQCGRNLLDVKDS